MRVALVCPYDWTRHGGVQGHVRELARHLAGDHEVAVLAPHRPGVAPPPVPARVVDVGRPVGVAFNRSVAPVALAPRSASRVARQLRAWRPDVVHVHEPLAPLVSLAAVALGPRPLVGTFHAWSDRDRAYRALGRLTRRVDARLDARIAVSPAAQRYAATALRRPVGRFAIIPNGVAVADHAAARPLPDLVDRDRPLLLFVGRLEPRKGLDVLVRAFLRVRAAVPRARLCVVGDGPERRRCQSMVPGSIRHDALFVGEVDDDQKRRYYASADVFVAPNVGGESFGIVLLEAMAAGLPVVASDIPGFHAVMTDGLEGRFAPAGDAAALADAIAALVSGDKLRRAMSAQARTRAARFAWPAVAADVARVYEKVT